MSLNFGVGRPPTATDGSHPRRGHYCPESFPDEYDRVKLVLVRSSGGGDGSGSAGVQ